MSQLGYRDCAMDVDGSSNKLDKCETCQSSAADVFCCMNGGTRPFEKIRQCFQFKIGEVIFRTGESPQGLYIVKSGLVKLEVISLDGAAHILRMKGPGGSLGYRALFANEPYRATAIAAKESALCFISKPNLIEFIGGNPEIAMKLLTQLAEDLREAEKKWVTQMDARAPERVAAALLFFDEHFPGQKWTRREIGDWAGTSAETVMRVLSSFKKEGLFHSSEQNIQLTDRKKLEKKLRALNP